MIAMASWIAAFITAFTAIPLMIPRLKRNGISGKDRNKTDNLDVAEMGGLGIILGFGAGIILMVFVVSFTRRRNYPDGLRGQFYRSAAFG
jgi:UDP-N-acetylglucosamine--dolichyl-phosphate N-acetylglucosaminephosphotransferase